MKFKYLSLFFCIVFFLAAANAAELKESKSTWLDASRITQSSDLATITLNPEWQFIPGKSGTGWMSTFRNGIPFSLKKNLIDFDSLIGEKSPAGTEAVLYNRFQADRDGVAQLGVGCDWWFEAYSNGIACTSTMESGNETNHFAPANNPFFLPVRKGENLLAIRVRRGSDSWQFACGNIPFVLPELPQLRYGPWLGDPDTGKMSIRFVTCGKIGSGIQFRKRGEKNWQTRWDHLHGQILRRTFHKIHLSGLEKGAEYEYRIIMLDPEKPEKQTYAKNGKIYTFRVPDERQNEFSFFYTADLQFPLQRQKQLLNLLLKAANASDCDFYVLGGDIGNAFSSKDLFRGVLTQLSQFGGEKQPIVMLRGNHELRGKEADRYLYYFGNEEGVSYGIFRFGDTAFLVLDCWEDKPAESPGAHYTKYNLDSLFLKENKEFLKKALASEKWTSATRRIVLAHGAPYSTFDACMWMPFNIQKLTDPYFGGRNPKSRLNLWLAGHAHRYTRSIPGTDSLAAPPNPRKPHKGGKEYIYPVLTVAGPGGHPTMPVSAFRVDAKAGKLIVRAFRPDGTCFEKIEISDDGTIREIISLPHHDF